MLILLGAVRDHDATRGVDQTVQLRLWIGEIEEKNERRGNDKRQRENERKRERNTDLRVGEGGPSNFVDGLRRLRLIRSFCCHNRCILCAVEGNEEGRKERDDDKEDEYVRVCMCAKLCIIRYPFFII